MALNAHHIYLVALSTGSARRCETRRTGPPPVDPDGPLVRTLGISTDLSRSAWLKALQEYQPAGAQAIDEHGSLSANLSTDTIPRFLLIDLDGIVLYEGGDLKALRQAVEALSGVKPASERAGVF